MLVSEYAIQNIILKISGKSGSGNMEFVPEHLIITNSLGGISIASVTTAVCKLTDKSGVVVQEVGKEASTLVSNIQSNYYYADIVVVSESSQYVGSDTIFRGIISNCSQATQMDSDGHSRAVLVINILHRASELRLIGANGCLYGQPEHYPDPGISIANMITSQYKAKDEKLNTVESIVHATMGDCSSLSSGGYVLKSGVAIEDILASLFKHLKDAGRVIPNKYVSSDIDIKDYFDGGTTPNIKGYPQANRTFIAMLVGMIQNIVVSFDGSNIFDAIVNTLSRPEFSLTIVCRDKKISIIPNDGWQTGTGRTKVNIPESLITSIKSDRLSVSSVNAPDGILITATPSTYYNGGVNNFGSILGVYPSKGSGKTPHFRWLQVPAPGWFNSASVSEYAVSKKGASDTDNKDFRTNLENMCNMYAKTLYTNYAYRTSTAFSGLSPDMLICRPWYLVGDVISFGGGVYAPTLAGRVESVTVNYSTTGRQSTLSISMSLSHVRPSDESKEGPENDGVNPMWTSNGKSTNYIKTTETLISNILEARKVRA